MRNAVIDDQFTLLSIVYYSVVISRIRNTTTYRKRCLTWKYSNTQNRFFILCKTSGDNVDP